MPSVRAYPHRDVLRRGACCAGLAVVLAGCLAPDPGSGSKTSDLAGARSTLPDSSAAPVSLDAGVLASRRFGEAPVLADAVRSGSLPAVDERLPANPLVLRPVDEIGRYGGVLRRALTGDVVQTAGVRKTLSEGLMGFSRPMPDSIVPNLAESFRFSPDSRSATFRLREGLRWSDGVPFTVDDILFWYEDMLLDEEARNDAVIPGVWLVDGEPIRLEKVDALTVRAMSKKPLGRIKHAFSGDVSAYPKHRLKHLHPRYNPGSTYQTFRDSTTSAQLTLQPGLPRMSAWIPVRWERGQRVVFDRNPYYFKVDTAGNQLPYADGIEFRVIQDTQVILLKFINGEIDLFGRYAQLDMFPTLRAEEAKGRFELRITGPERGLAFYLNWDAPHAALREAFRDLGVRQALSIAINREEINQILYHGLLDISGYSFPPQSAYFSEAAYRMYSEFDPARARALLDEAGYVDLDGDGVRELKDGTPFATTIDVQISPKMAVSVCELVAEHWRDVGVHADLNPLLRDLLYPRRANGEFDIHVWDLEGAADPLGYMNDWGIMSPTGPFWHRHAMREAPEWLWRVTEHVSAAMTTVDTTDLRVHMTAIRDLHTANVPVIVIGATYYVWGANTRLGNVPRENSAADVFRGWGRPVMHEQIFVKPEGHRNQQ